MSDIDDQIFVNKYSENIYTMLNRDKLPITFIRVRDDLVILTDYLNLGVYGETNNILSIDFVGGPDLSVGDTLVFGMKIPFLTGRVIKQFTCSQYCVYIHLEK